MKLYNYAGVLLLFIGLSNIASAQLWKQYADSAKIYNALGQTNKAINFYEEEKKVLLTDSPETFLYLLLCNSLGVAYTTIGKYDTAKYFFSIVLHLQEKGFGTSVPDSAFLCNDLGYYYLKTAKYEKAEPLLKRSKEIREEIYGQSDIRTAETYTNLGHLYREKGDNSEAENFYTHAKSIYGIITGKKSNLYAISCNNLGIIYKILGEYEKAESLLLEARAIRTEILGSGSIEYAANCSDLANLYRIMGKLKEAEGLHLESKSIREKVYGKENIDYASSCNNLASIYLTMGDYDKAESLFLETKEIREKLMGKMHPDYAGSCFNLATLYTYMRQYDKAEVLFVEAGKIWKEKLGENHPRYAAYCNNFAGFYLSTGGYVKAKSLYQESIQICLKISGKKNDYATSCNNLASVYEYMGEYDSAELYYREAQEIYLQVLGRDHPDYASNLDGLAGLYLIMGKYDQSEKLYLESRQIFAGELGKEHKIFLENNLKLAELYRSWNKPEQAVLYYEKAFQSQNERIKKIFQFTSETEKQSYLKKTYDLVNAFLTFQTSSGSVNNPGLTYNITIASRNLILSSSQQLRNQVYNATDTSIQNKYNRWIEDREQLAFWYAKPIAIRPTYVSNLEAEANTLEKELTRLSSAFEKGQNQNDVSWKSVQQNLQSTEAAIEFVKFNYYTGQRMTDSIYYVALLLKNDHEPEMISLFESKQLDHLLNTGNSSKTINGLYSHSIKGDSAYQLIWAPIENHLSGITKIYFAPAGLLYRISFHALPMNNQQVLSDKYQLVQLNTTADVVGQSSNYISTTDPIMLYGGIEYDVDTLALKETTLAYRRIDVNNKSLPEDLVRGNTWQYLPGTQREINDIVALGKREKYSITSVSGVAATEESIKALNNQHSPSVLHIATHGFFFPDPASVRKINPSGSASDNAFKKSNNPLFRSGLLFAGANNAWKGSSIEGVEDGILTAYEVSNIYLPKTKLVVLSACETGLGDIQDNEGVYGLQRAFKIAGAQNLVMSLWKVPDQATTEFMTEFYKNLFDHQSINDAYFHAQTELKNKYRTEPYKWAAWILVK